MNGNINRGKYWKQTKVQIVSACFEPDVDFSFSLVEKDRKRKRKRERKRERNSVLFKSFYPISY